MTGSIPFLNRMLLPRDIRHRLHHDKKLKKIYLKYSKPKYNLKTPIAETRFVILDTETTGFHAYAGDEMISIAMIEYQGLKPSKKIFESFINPQRKIPAESTEIHGIVDTDVANAPTLVELLPDILEFVDDAVLVGHHIQFDYRFINKTLNSYLGFKLGNQWLDTMLLFLAHQGRLGHYELEQVAKACDIEIHNRHSALGDSQAAGEIFSYLSHQLCSDSEPVINLIKQQVSDSPMPP